MGSSLPDLSQYLEVSKISFDSVDEQTTAGRQARVLAENYVTEKKVYKLLQLIAAHILTEEPEDPLVYVYELTTRLLNFRNTRSSEPPVIFKKFHFNILAKKLAGQSRHKMSKEQFEKGMKIFGIENYIIPSGLDDRHISLESFIDVGWSTLVNNLVDTLGPPSEIPPKDSEVDLLL